MATREVNDFVTGYRGFADVFDEIAVGEDGSCVVHHLDGGLGAHLISGGKVISAHTRKATRPTPCAWPLYRLRREFLRTPATATNCRHKIWCHEPNLEATGSCVISLQDVL